MNDSTVSKKQAIERLLKMSNWYGYYDLGNGKKIEPTANELYHHHQTRIDLVFGFLEKYLNGRFDEKTFLDTGCCDGFFSFQLASRKAKRVLGVDLKPENIERANLLNVVFNHRNLEFKVHDLCEKSVAELGEFDIVLNFGVLYHSNKPVEILENLFRITRQLVVVDTYVDSDTTAVIGPFLRGYFEDMSHPRGGNSPFVFMPNLAMVVHLMRHVGFKNIVRILHDKTSYDAYLKYRKVILVGFK